jgi:hypothetical protein
VLTTVFLAEFYTEYNNLKFKANRVAAGFIMHKSSAGRSISGILSIMNTKIKIFRVLSWFVSLYHIGLGLIATFSPSGVIQVVADKVYHLTVTIQPELMVVFSRFIGSYMIAFGVMMALVAHKPKEYKKFAWIAVLLFGIRIFDRTVLFASLGSLGVTWAQNLETVIPIGLIALGLAFCMPKDNE